MGLFDSWGGAQTEGGGGAWTQPVTFFVVFFALGDGLEANH